MRSVRWYGPTLVLLVTALLVMLAGPGVARRIAHQYDETRIELVKDTLTNNPTLEELSSAFKKVATVVEPSVVHIQVYARQESQARRGGSDPREEMLRRFFGDRIPQELLPDEGAPGSAPGSAPENGPGNDSETAPGRNPRQRGQDQGDFDKYNVPQQYGNGSGWVFDDQGHIITNNHVIEGADKIVVRFHDGSEREAKVQGTDPKTDVAVLKVEGGNLHPAKLAAGPVEQGEIVFAFGSPFRFEFSMSQGIVSAKGRRLGIIGNGGYENFIQTDAAINPGNSGGPLTNVLGDVVGMNSAIATRTGSYNGLGFAIPVDMVKRVAEQLIAKGKVARGYLGVYIEDLDARMARTFGFEGQGVLVAQPPIAGTPAEKAGLKRGDIITGINGRDFANADELRNYVASLEPEKIVEVTVFRSGKTEKLDVTIGLLPDQMAAAGRESVPNGGGVATEAQVLRKLGLESVRTFTQDMADQARMTFTPGVLVWSVRQGSVAASEMIRRGAIITDVMGKAVTNVDELVAELKRHDLAKGVRLSVRDGDTDRFVLLQLTE